LLLADTSVNNLGRHIHTVSTRGDNVICSSDVVTNLAQCSHEETDTRLLLHVADIVKNGMERVIIRTVDSDVLVLCVPYYFLIHDIGELWIAFGTGKNYRLISANLIAKKLGCIKSAALNGFHAFTGCDTASVLM